MLELPKTRPKRRHVRFCQPTERIFRSSKNSHKTDRFSSASLHRNLPRRGCTVSFFPPFATNPKDDFMLKRLLIALALSAISGTGPTAAQNAPPEVTVASPVVKPIVEDDEFVGRFEAASSVDVRSRVSGYLEDVHFTDGSLVKEGDVLFTIDQRLFKIALRQAESGSRNAQASFDFAQDQLKRAQSLVANGNIAQSTVDERRERFLNASGALEQAKQSLESGADQPRLLGDTSRRFRAGSTGGFVTPGNLVKADDTMLTTIVSIDPIYFYFDIDERYFLAYSKDARTRGSSLQEGGGGLEVKIRLSDEKLAPFAGKLDFSENRIDAATGSMRVRADRAEPRRRADPGSFSVGSTCRVPSRTRVFSFRTWRWWRTRTASS